MSYLNHSWYLQYFTVDMQIIKDFYKLITILLY